MPINKRQPAAVYNWYVSWCGCSYSGGARSFKEALKVLEEHGEGFCPIGIYNQRRSEEDSVRLYAEHLKQIAEFDAA